MSNVEQSRIKFNWILSSYKGFQFLDKYLEGRLDEMKFDPTINPIMDGLGFESCRVKHPEGKFDVLAGVLDLEGVGEFDSLPLVEDEIIGKKGYNTERFGAKRGMSRRFTEWMKNATGSETDIPEFIESDIKELTDSTVRLMKRAQKTKNFMATRLFTEGLKNNTTSFGPWSQTIKGKALFATDHPYGEDEAGAPLGTQSNKLTYEISKPAILEAIELLREMKDENGTTMGQASDYTIVVPTQLSRKIRETLSDGFNFVGAEAGNDSIPNTFDWDGYRITILELPTLNQPSKKYGRVGDEKQWFLIDTATAREVGAFKFIWLYDSIMEFYKDDDSKATFYDIDLEFTAEHFNYQCVVGSTGVDAHPDA